MPLGGFVRLLHALLLTRPAPFVYLCIWLNINKLIRVSRQLLQELGREPMPEEIAKEMDTTVDRVREIMKIAQEPVSLETPIGEEEDSHLGIY